MHNMKVILTGLLLLSTYLGLSNRILIPMDKTQTNHLKSYGITYWVIEQGLDCQWLLNYKGGSFVLPYIKPFEEECIIRGVSYKIISDQEYEGIVQEISSPAVNQDVIKLEKAPKIAVYSPKSKQPWDDAVTLVLTYAEIPYEVIFDDEILADSLSNYDWLHLHHEDFTGQYGKFWGHYRNRPWYIQQQEEFELSARKHGFDKVSQLKLAVVHKIRDFCTTGGFLFAMCSATDSYDIALAAEGADICAEMFDGDPADPKAQEKLDFNKTFAFQNFELEKNPSVYEYSNIDVNPKLRGVTEKNDYFSLFEYSAKWDPIPTMLTQNHEKTIKGFMGQTTAFNKDLIKADVVIMGENKELNEAKYIHGIYGKGFWTFYGGHDPGDYQHFVGEAPTDMNLHANSESYRLILNNILFPAAKKKKRKT